MFFWGVMVSLQGLLSVSVLSAHSAQNTLNIRNVWYFKALQPTNFTPCSNPVSCAKLPMIFCDRACLSSTPLHRPPTFADSKQPKLRRANLRPGPVLGLSWIDKSNINTRFAILAPLHSTKRCGLASSKTPTPPKKGHIYIYRSIYIANPQKTFPP